MRKLLESDQLSQYLTRFILQETKFLVAVMTKVMLTELGVAPVVKLILEELVELDIEEEE